MEDLIQTWIYSVLVSGCVCSILMFFNTDGKMKPLLETGCACAMILTFLSPVNKICLSPNISADYNHMYKNFSICIDYDDKFKAFIEEQYRAYILNEAKSFGVSLTEAKVTAVQDENENWIPYEVFYTTDHLIDDEFMKHISNELGIAEERQHINDANEVQ